MGIMTRLEGTDIHQKFCSSSGKLRQCNSQVGATGSMTGISSNNGAGAKTGISSNAGVCLDARTSLKGWD
jgi:hypothetical protein